MCVMNGAFFIITTQKEQNLTWNITSKDRKYAVIGYFSP